MHKFVRYYNSDFLNGIYILRKYFIFRVQLPDLQVVDARLDFSNQVLRVTNEFCRELGIRYPEELSLKRNIPPDVLRKGANIDSDREVIPYMMPGEVIILL